MVVDGVSSEWARVYMGVPQGPLLGLLLFLIFVNNLPEVVEECTINFYADDTTIYSALNNNALAVEWKETLGGWWTAQRS